MSRITASSLASVVAAWMVLPFVAEARAADAVPESDIVIREDLVYGRVHGAGLLADVAYPKSENPTPAIISVHGGRWRGGHKRDGSTIVVRQWAEFGFFAM